jgi:hypothetical protein
MRFRTRNYQSRNKHDACVLMYAFFTSQYPGFGVTSLGRKAPAILAAA